MTENKPEDGKKVSPNQTYRPISEKEMEDSVVSQTKSESKSKFKEADGADERMLSKEDTMLSSNSDIPLKDVKIVMSEKNGEAKVDGEEQKNKFGGMSKEELMKFANDPFWVRLRWFLFIFFWVLWAAMLVGAIMIIYAAPKCDPPPPRTWWQVGPLAEIKNMNPAELKSSNGIKGLIIKYTEDPYLPVNESHHVIQLLKRVKEIGANAIIDLDPSTTDLWFNESQNNNSNFYDYYIWQPPKYAGEARQPPNNWLYLNNNSSWIFSPKRNQYYYAPLLKPHLNFRNQIVVKEFGEVMKRFIKYGASGFRIRNGPLLLVDPKFEDETLITKKVGVDVGEPGFFIPSKTLNVPDLKKLFLNWKEIVRNVTEDGLLMVAEELGKVQSYQENNTLVVDLPLLQNIFAKPNVKAIVQKLNQTFKFDNIKWPLWKEKSSSLPSDVVTIVTNLLPGTTLVDLNATIDPQLVKIRESPSIMRGNCDMYAISNYTVFAFVRNIRKSRCSCSIEYR
ncbi:unnamed protein product [Psylliodes chrysocephalus]|uniref:alpha-glucosidase n=1 Tax=Psylliodes chrysocephalus TaxID=3402493 RepID=A0A9P0GIR8_9CUCU|nr:unnamed protein product [Psylliodes chrysocephala]